MGRYLCHHARKAWVAQPLLHGGQRGVAPDLGVDDPARVQPGGRQSRGKEVGAFQHPQHRAGVAGEDAGRKKGRCSSEFGIDAFTSDFVQRSKRQAPTGKGRIDAGVVERQNAGRVLNAGPLDSRDSGTKLVEGVCNIHVLTLF